MNNHSVLTQQSFYILSEGYLYLGYNIPSSTFSLKIGQYII